MCRSAKKKNEKRNPKPIRVRVWMLGSGHLMLIKVVINDGN